MNVVDPDPDLDPDSIVSLGSDLDTGKPKRPLSNKMKKFNVLK